MRQVMIRALGADQAFFRVAVEVAEEAAVAFGLALLGAAEHGVQLVHGLVRQQRAQEHHRVAHGRQVGLEIAARDAEQLRHVGAPGQYRLGADPAVAVHQRVSYLPGDARLPEALKGRDVLRFFSQVRSQGELRRAIALAERLELDISRQVALMSTGMRQKLALAAVMSVDAPLLVLDEPTSNLDPTIRADVLNLVREARTAGRTVIFSSHVLSEVEALTQSFLLFHGSRLLASGSAAEVRSMLADVANEIVIRCTQPRELARRLVGDDSVEAIRLGHVDELAVATRSPAELLEQLPRMAAAAGSDILEVRSTDGSLQSLFSSLVRMRRGML